MIVTIFTTRILSTKLFDGDESVLNPDANTPLNEFFRRSILSASLNQMVEDPDRQKCIRDTILESWLDKKNDSGNPYFAAETRQELHSLILDYYKELDNEGNESIKNSLKVKIDSIHPSPFSFNDLFALGLSFKDFPNAKKSITGHLLHLTDDYLKKAGIIIDNNRSIFSVKVNGKSPAKGVYGIECLDSANGSKEWIKTLLECAKHLEGANDSQEGKTVQLILHDKDLPNDAFGQHDKDVYVLNDEELDLLVPGWNTNGIAQLKIAFFHHTTNALAHLVQNSYDGKDIHEAVSTYLSDYFTNKNKVEDLDDTLYQ